MLVYLPMYTNSIAGHERVVKPLSVPVICNRALFILAGIVLTRLQELFLHMAGELFFTAITEAAGGQVF